MRSDLIYEAVSAVQNRYKLCQLASKATRKFHRPNTRIQETMNDVLLRFGGTGRVEETPAQQLASAERRAA
jgi:hypothetical protein